MQLNNSNSPYPLSTFAQLQMDVSLVHSFPLEEMVRNVVPMGAKERAQMERRLLRRVRGN
jgi:hypothetical protein